MSYIAYIYDKDNNVIAQIEEILDIEITKKLNDVSTASFGLYQSDPYCTRNYLKEYRRCKINLQTWNIEQTMFDWIIRWFDADLEKTSIKLESFEHLFDRRLLQNNYNYTGATIDAILTTILNDINTTYNTNITLDCWIITTTSKIYNKGETFLKVLKDLAGLWYEFIVDNMVLKFKQTIWIDRTTWSEFVEYRFDVTKPDDRSIDSVKMTVDGKELANGVIGKSWSNYTNLTDATSISDFWLIESSFTNSWDDANATQSYLEDHKESLSEFEISAETNDFFEANLWDMVKIFIFVGNDIMFFDWAMKVIQKRYIGWDLPKIQYTIWKTKIQSKDFIDEIADLKNRVKTIELN